MTMSEIITVLIAFHMSHHRDFKNYYKGYIAKFYKSHFPNLLSYTRFLEVMPKAIINYRAEIVDAKLTTGNVHDTKPVPDITKKLSGKLYADNDTSTPLHCAIC